MKDKTEKISLFLVFIILIYFPIFLHLDQVGLYLWDEATNALQAYDMSQDGHYLRRHFLNRPDNWETKPPMLIWMQVICMKIFGYNELAVRLPSALAALATVLLILRFFIKELNLLAGGIFSGLILLCSTGYVRGHVSRSGDHDALLIFFLTLGLLYFYKFLKNPEKRNTSLIIFTIAFIGGVMTKSIAGLFFAPALLVFTIFEKQFLPTIKLKSFWMSVSLFFACIISYYALNEYYYPGYLDLIWKNELFPRFSNTAEGYNYNKLPHPFYYLEVIVTSEFKWFYLLIPFSLLLVFLQKNQALKRFIFLVLITAGLFLFIISKGSYNSWYHAPVFPLLSIICGAGLGIVYEALKEKLNVSQTIFSILFPILFLFTFFFIPYQSIIKEECYFPQLHKHDPHYGGFLKKLKKENPDLKDLFVYYEPLNRHFLFYQRVYNDQYDYQINSCGPGGSILDCPPKRKVQIGEKVMVCNKRIKEEVLTIFEVQKLNHYKNCDLYLILSVKKTN